MRLLKKSKMFEFTFQDKFFEIFLIISVLVSLLFIGTIGILALEKGLMNSSVLL